MVLAFILFSLCLWHLVGVFGDDADEVKSVSVMKGDSVTLNIDVTEVHKYLLIQWAFGSTRIAEFNRLTQTNSTYDGPDERFRDRLKLDQTGSLTITNTTTTDSGLYQLTIVSRGSSYINFNLTVYDVTNEEKSVSVMEGDSVTLNTDVTEAQKYLLIQWTFGGTRIAEVSRLMQTSSTYDGPDERFRDRLKVDQTGSLTITNTTTTDSGLYQLTIVSRGSSYINFNLTVYDVTNEVKSVSVMKGDSVTLNTDVTESHKYLLIQWTFRGTRIAEVSRLMQTSSTYDERFRDRLKVDQTGSLTITNTRTTDSGLYQLTIVSRETSYMSFNVKVLERSSSSNCVSSSSAVNNSTINQTEDANITDLYQPSSDHIHCCGFTEAVIRLVVSALVGVATVAVLVYDIRSTRSELIRTNNTRHHHQTHQINQTNSVN
ncbi:uncharacterized protein LOC125261683 isoform X2 [Megalobrama amblycephala]|uniref:uncharacterized protein LOC125261683 isoform X2 n=1 Tax=Megalobrama amblycephala TaxID=75352 RepID=UPI00201445BF|nr:uncharacterized protein LOC125261683 isoform X2 [Megalobrama amblycephala]